MTDLPPSSSRPAADTTPDVTPDVTDADLLEAAREIVLPGFVGREEAVVTLAEYLELDDDPRPAQVVGAVWSEREAEQATWTGTSDHDRLRTAFDSLAEQGVVARMSFTCCQTCGTDEIDDERTPNPDAAPGTYPWREWAYTFFHAQDAERLADLPADLYLGFGTWRPAPGLDEALVVRAQAGDQAARREAGRASDAAVAGLVATALSDAGLTVDWDGDPARRVAVRIEAWRRPLPA